MISSALLMLLSLLSSVQLSAAESERCLLPEMRKKLDVERLSNTSWYTGLQTKDITASAITCVRFSNFTSTTSGFGVVLTEHGDRLVQFENHFNYVKNGIYRVSKSERELDHAEYVRESNGLDEKTVLRIDHVVADGNQVFLTDYKNYIAGFICPPDPIIDNEHRFVWGFFPSPNPTLSQIAAFMNVLHDAGISTHFHSSTCSETNWSQSLQIPK
uniref:uncharacterized protein LOC120341065 n=1 Tax=Styela clava TaxID=7725 RepID=UPI00193A4BAE|nr:uncharacterized protein LOC120341065 [Styela clava]